MVVMGQYHHQYIGRPPLLTVLIIHSAGTLRTAEVLSPHLVMPVSYGHNKQSRLDIHRIIVLMYHINHSVRPSRARTLSVFSSYHFDPHSTRIGLDAHPYGMCRSNRRTYASIAHDILRQTFPSTTTPIGHPGRSWSSRPVGYAPFSGHCQSRVSP